MNPADFDFYKTFLKTESGLTLGPDKAYLLESRLTPLAKKYNFPDLETFTRDLKLNKNRAVMKEVVEAMTTNETSFFRDTKPFELFNTVVLPKMMEARKIQRKIRIWCAASSTGQEPYSLAMELKEKQALLAGWNIEIIATDIADSIIETARRATYSQFEVQRGLPIQYLVKYFKQEGERWILSDDIKRMVRFQNFNLLTPMTMLGNFDVVLCRNVLIYFDEQTKRMVLENIAKQLAPDGFLFLGGAETVLGITDSFKLMENCRGLYVRNPAAAKTGLSPGQQALA